MWFGRETLQQVRQRFLLSVNDLLNTLVSVERDGILKKKPLYKKLMTLVARVMTTFTYSQFDLRWHFFGRAVLNDHSKNAMNHLKHVDGTTPLNLNLFQQTFNACGRSTSCSFRFIIISFSPNQSITCHYCSSLGEGEGATIVWFLQKIEIRSI